MPIKDPNVAWEDRDLFEDESTNENENDIRVLASDFKRLLIAPSDWTVKTIYELIGKQIQLDPAYQRRNVWQAKSKSQFIESLFLGIPIPQILLASKAGQKNSFLVLDGKQRLTTIREFIDGNFSDGREFKLRELRVLKDLNGRSWAEIKEDEELADQLFNEPLRTTVLRGWESESVLYEIFYRLNSGSVKLSPMELRMSLLPGGFLKFIIAWTENIGPIHRLLRKRQPDARMSDVELSIRFLAFKDQEIQYAGDLKRFLDDFCRNKNLLFSENKDEEQFHCEYMLRQMDNGIESGLIEFSLNDFCRKYRGGDYETRFNRAVFDILVGALSFEEVRTWVLQNPGQMKNCYERVSRENPQFIKSLESTTKSSEATRTRFQVWYHAIEELMNIRLPIPNVK